MNENLLMYLCFSVFVYAVFELIFHLPDKIEKSSRKVRILFRFGVMFLWPIYIPIGCVITLICMIFWFFKSLFE